MTPISPTGITYSLTWLSIEQTRLVPANEEAVETAEVETSTDESNQDTVMESADSTISENKMKGVVRNLLDGHFKGVSDVRLRINFRDDIATLEMERMVQVAQEGVSDLIQTVTGEVDAFLQSESLDDQILSTISEASDTFTSSVSQAVDSFQSDQPVKTDELISEIQTEFDDLVVSVTASFNSSSEANTEETDIPADNIIINPDRTANFPPSLADILSVENDVSLSYEQFIMDLTAAFELKLNELMMRLSEVKVLPDLSEPEGNGQSFQKFLTIYNGLLESDAIDLRT